MTASATYRPLHKQHLQQARSTTKISLHTTYKRKPEEAIMPQQNYNEIYRTQNNPQPSPNQTSNVRSVQSKEMHIDNTH
jgi:hypothetical protein